MRKLFKNISIYSSANIFNKSIQFLLLPIYTRVLLPSDYGKLELVYVTGSILAILNGFLIQNAYSRFYFDHNKDPSYHNKVYSSSLVFMIFCSFITYLLFYYYSDSIAYYILNSKSDSVYVKLIAFSSILLAINQVPEKTLIVQQKSKSYAFGNILNTIITIITTIYFLLFLGLGIEGVLWGQILGRFVRLLVLIYFTYKMFIFSISFKIIISLLSFSVFLIPTQLSSFIAYFSNRFFLQEFNSLNEVGIFSLSYKIASIIPILLSGPIKLAVTPYIYSEISNPIKCKNNLKKITLLVLIILTIFSLLLSLISKELIILMANKSYYESYQLIFPLSIGYVLIGMAGIVVIGINIIKKTWIIMITWLSSAIINLICNYFLVSNYGLFGAAYSTVITFIFILALYFIFVEKYYKISFEYIKYFQIIFSSILVYLLCENISILGIYLLLFKLIIFTLYLIFIIRLYLDNELKIYVVMLAPNGSYRMILSKLIAV